MILAIDAGNTRIKWGLLNDATGELTNLGACFHDALTSAAFPQTTSITTVIISNVAGESIAKALQQKLDQSFKYSRVKVKWIASTRQAGSLTNGYDDPVTLGSDRWSAMVGAWHQTQQSCVVVSIGTSITIDLIYANPDNAEQRSATFVGGTIMPGLLTMAKSLRTNTAALPDIQTHMAQTPNMTELGLTKYGTPSTIGTNTTDAISHGIFNAVLGAIEQTATSLFQLSQTKPLVVLSGGDAAPIAKRLQQISPENSVIKEMRIIENLVLLGLFYLCNPSASIKATASLHSNVSKVSKVK